MLFQQEKRKNKYKPVSDQSCQHSRRRKIKHALNHGNKKVGDTQQLRFHPLFPHSLRHRRQNSQKTNYLGHTLEPAQQICTYGVSFLPPMTRLGVQSLMTTTTDGTFAHIAKN